MSADPRRLAREYRERAAAGPPKRPILTWAKDKQATARRAGAATRATFATRRLLQNGLPGEPGAPLVRSDEGAAIYPVPPRPRRAGGLPPVGNAKARLAGEKGRRARLATRGVEQFFREVNGE